MIRINFSKQSLNLSNFITINGEIRTHYAMFSRNSSKSNRLLSTITIIIILQPKDSRNCCSISKTKTPSRRRFNSGFRRLLTSHREIAQKTRDLDIVIASQILILLNNLTITISNFSRYLSMPHCTRQKSFNRINQPNKIWMGICNFNLRYTNCGSHTFRYGRNFKRKITKLMQLSNLLRFKSSFSKSSIQNTLIFGNNFLFRPVKEISVEPINKIFFNKSLKAKHSNFISILQAAHTRSIIRNHFGQSSRILRGMTYFIKIYH